MPISDVNLIKGIGVIVTGRIEQSIINSANNVKFYPTKSIGKISTIEMHCKQLDSAACGDNVSINVKNVNNIPKVGDVMVVDNMKLDPGPPSNSKRFTALVFIQNYSRKINSAKLDNK